MEKTGYIHIGEVVSELKKEFDNISISKIRYFEGKGLINSTRVGGGYRKFTHKEVERLKLILKWQNEDYLPLKVIRQKLEDLDSGRLEEKAEISEGAPERLEPLPLPLMEEEGIFTKEEAAEKIGLSISQIDEIESYSLVKTVSRDGKEGYSGADLKVMQIVKEFLRYGIEPRHLRMYQIFVEREASFYQTILNPYLKQKDPDTRREVKRKISQLAKLSEQLKRTLLQNKLISYYQG